MSSSDSPSLSPSSLPLPSLRTSPFSVLPPELTQLIIEHTIPPTFHSDTHKARQSTLRSLCLVSKSLHHIARPLLLATLWIGYSSNYKTWKDIYAKGDDRLLCREIIFDHSQEKLNSNLALAGYFGLRTLAINESVATLDLSVISELPRLFRLFFFEWEHEETDRGSWRSELSLLRLSRMALSASTQLSLPNLYELGLFQLKSVNDQARFLNPSSLPSLRLFTYYEASGLRFGIGEALPLLLPQLHAIFLNFCSISYLTPELLKKLDPITLFDADIDDVEDTIPISHLRFDILSYQDNLEDTRDLLLGTQISLPLTVYFPLSASPDAPNDFNTVSDRRHLLETCTKRGIEVVYEDTPYAWWLNAGLSELFIEKMKEERRRKGGDVQGRSKF